MKTYILHFFAILFCGAFSLYAQAPDVNFQMGFGGAHRDTLKKTFQESDGSYFLFGTSESGISGDKDTELYGMADTWIIKTNPAGEIVWQKTFGGDKDDFLHDVVLLDNGHFLFGSSSLSAPSGNKTAPKIGWVDYWLVEMDTSGSSISQSSFGGDDNDILRCIVPTADGGLILAGKSESDAYGTKTENSRGGYDYWLVKLDTLGEVQWDKTLGGSEDEELTTVIQTSSGGYLVCGHSNSPASGDKSESTSLWSSDWWVVLLDSAGAMVWEKTIGGSSLDYVYDGIELPTGNYLLGGASDSNISGEKTEASIGSFDYWLAEITPDGSVVKDEVIGAYAADYLKSIVKLSDSTFALVGESGSEPSVDKTSAWYGSLDIWIVVTDMDYNVLFDISSGGLGNDYLSEASVMNNLLSISTFSYSGISGSKEIDNEGLLDYWFMEMSSCSDTVSMYFDMDGDGYGGSDSIVTLACSFPAGYSFIQGDCNDLDPAIHPAATETCNGVDENCNGLIDDEVPLINCYLDADGDGFGTPDSLILSCFIPDGYINNPWDCNDLDNTIHNLVTYWLDADGDGYGTNDSFDLFCLNSPPEGYSSFNGDCDDSNPDVVDVELFYEDNDLDGYGQPGSGFYTCPDPGPGFCKNANDCDDSNPDIYPGAPELPNGIDDNCNFAVDEGLVEVTDIGQEGWTLYPNPADGELLLEFSGRGVGSGSYAVYALTGEVILQGVLSGNMTRIDLTGLPEGAWLLEWKTSDSTQRSPFLVVRE